MNFDDVMGEIVTIVFIRELACIGKERKFILFMKKQGLRSCIKIID
ncbi:MULTISPECIES: hypothetical protein [Bacillus]|nr:MULTISPECIES: hypothetical protein [Bacillus]HWO75882.1 hypothetical protein [Bacillus sp. (in: firmicutes)]MDU0069726.1 hypothetical protein [Bacillus sp. IG6]MED8018011.1 hypothetical protein [Bacillus glycinifermentans]WKB79417.1 hypothetical protein QYM22_11455 [Bacillus glycinifermentans]SCA86020.1 hypothetical protein BGLY_2197 [Bacillus glycinifermentans]